ncbi:TIGR02391 family protein [Streptomyces scopuliridis]|uniref:TIGR02391 family protein n=1 Tax=Streptomyces scopuliridis TaxID=452529 RepID=UPI0036B70722
MARRDFSADALVPHGHHQNWRLIEAIIKEIERVTDQWPDAETEINVKGKRDLHGSYNSLIDTKIGLGDDHRDVTKVEITRLERDGEESDMYISVTLSKSPRDTSSVYASGPVKRTCEELARGLQAFILQAINHPEIARVSTGGGGTETELQHLHPAVRLGALARLASGHGDEAVEEACKSVGAKLRELSGLDDDGASLVSTALGSRRMIAINDGVTKSDESEQKGYMYLGMALYLAARNPRTHRPSDPNFNHSEVIEWLSVASALHRALERVKPIHKAP